MKKIELKPICGDNILSAFDLELEDRQKVYVSHPMRSLALGYAYHDCCRAFGIYDGEKMAGYIMLRFDAGNHACTIWHFMIDRSLQGHGYGYSALAAALEYIRSEAGFDCRRVTLTCHPKNDAALGLYRRFGFRETGRMEGVEIELELPLK